MDLLMRQDEGDRSDRHAGGNGAVSRSFRATASNGRAIRSFVDDVLRALPLGEEVVSDMKLVVSELAANAIEHGLGDELTVEVDTGRRGQWVEVAVTCVSDAAPALRAWRTWAIAPADARSGRGLGIVSRLTDDIHVEGRRDRMTVRCRRRVARAERS